MAFIWKLVTLIAVMLMPFAMTAAPATAAQGHHSASMPMQHCPEQSPERKAKAGFVECTMACSAALPAADIAADDPFASVCEPMTLAPVPRLHGLHPDTATPPPKGS